MPKRKTLTELYKNQLAVNREIQEDNSEQRKIMGKLTGIIKDFKDLLPKPFMEKVDPLIDEYERRFTMAGDNEKKTHPLFKEKA